MKTSRKFWGVFLLVAPFFGLGLTLTAYPIIAFIVAQLAYGEEQVPVGVMLLSKLVGIFGALCIAGVVVGFPVGFYLLVTSSKKSLPTTHDLEKPQDQISEPMTEEVRSTPEDQNS